MRVSAVGALCLSLCAPAVASAEDVTAALPGSVVPVGPAGTTGVSVVRTQVGTERFAVIRSRAAEVTSRCGVAPERAYLVVEGEVRLETPGSDPVVLRHAAFVGPGGPCGW